MPSSRKLFVYDLNCIIFCFCNPRLIKGSDSFPAIKQLEHINLLYRYGFAFITLHPAVHTEPIPCQSDSTAYTSAVGARSSKGNLAPAPFINGLQKISRQFPPSMHHPIVNKTNRPRIYFKPLDPGIWAYDRDKQASKLPPSSDLKPDGLPRLDYGRGIKCPNREPLPCLFQSKLFKLACSLFFVPLHRKCVGILSCHSAMQFPCYIDIKDASALRH